LVAGRRWRLGFGGLKRSVLRSGERRRFPVARIQTLLESVERRELVLKRGRVRSKRRQDVRHNRLQVAILLNDDRGERYEAVDDRADQGCIPDCLGQQHHD
jgi:hypothetical protein